MRLTRRQLLGAGALVGWAAAATAASPGRHIAFTNLHSGECVEMEYARGGAYQPAALAAIEDVLRDLRSGERHAIDPALMDYLADVAARAGRAASFEVISGYRSPRTNERLREKSAGVARNSLHMQGRAIDVRLHGVDTAALAGHALDLQRGGVGYYRASNFVHLDTGAFRTWRG